MVIAGAAPKGWQVDDSKAALGCSRKDSAKGGRHEMDGYFNHNSDEQAGAVDA